MKHIMYTLIFKVSKEFEHSEQRVVHSCKRKGMQNEK